MGGTGCAGPKSSQHHDHGEQGREDPEPGEELPANTLPLPPGEVHHDEVHEDQEEVLSVCLLNEIISLLRNARLI